MFADDTTPEARRFYYARLAELSPAERISIGMQLTAAADQLTREPSAADSPTPKARSSTTRCSGSVTVVRWPTRSTVDERPR